MTIRERYTIEDLIQEGKQQNYIAEKLSRDKSTISRELRRNRDSHGVFHAEKASNFACKRCKREKFHNITELAKSVIEEKLIIYWTPEQISKHLKKKHNMQISHELIYQYLAFDRKEGGDLYKKLPHRGEKYKNRNLKTRTRIWKEAKKRKSIDDRPPIVDEKSELGHWEGGTEFALHDEIEEELKTKVYFAHPYSPWERGLNEKTNGLIRKFYPKGTDFSHVTNEELLRVQNLINERPRKLLNYKTPKEVLCEKLLSKNSLSTIMSATL